LSAKDFVVACFGFLSPTKDSHGLLTAWLSSSLARDEDCRLVFVGENHPGKFGRKMLDAIKRAQAGGRISITGYSPPEDFVAWLSAADLAVQLRRSTRGETSGCVLNCLARGLPLIVNSLGSMAELPHDTVLKLPEVYDTAQLVDALESLRADAGRRAQLSAAAIAHIQRHHSPAEVALKYRDAIERAIASSRQTIYRRLIRKVAEIEGDKPTEEDLMAVAASIAANHPHRGACRAVEYDFS
jgi:glycosyltransferase involved in cell wall biosynthesis